MEAGSLIRPMFGGRPPKLVPRSAAHPLFGRHVGGGQSRGNPPERRAGVVTRDEVAVPNRKRWAPHVTGGTRPFGTVARRGISFTAPAPCGCAVLCDEDRCNPHRTCNSLRSPGQTVSPECFASQKAQTRPLGMLNRSVPTVAVACRSAAPPGPKRIEAVGVRPALRGIGQFGGPSSGRGPWPCRTL
jgi:hypothetical protein